MELSQMYLNESPAAHEMFCPPLSGGYNLHVHQVDSQPYTGVHTSLPSGHPFSQQGVCLPPSLLPSPLFSPLHLFPPLFLPPSSSLTFHCPLICVAEELGYKLPTSHHIHLPSSPPPPLLLPPTVQCGHWSPSNLHHWLCDNSPPPATEQSHRTICEFL